MQRLPQKRPKVRDASEKTAPGQGKIPSAPTLARYIFIFLCANKLSFDQLPDKTIIYPL
jgi:hypothetical protein